MICESILSPLWPMFFQALVHLAGSTAQTDVQLCMKALIVDYGMDQAAEIIVQKYTIPGAMIEMGFAMGKE